MTRSGLLSKSLMDWVAEYADLGMLEPLDPWLTKDYMDDIVPTFHQK